MVTVLEGGEGEELNAGVGGRGGRWSTTPTRGEDPKETNN